MTRPQYITDLSNVYTEMYHPSGRERPLTEKQMNDNDHDDEHDYDIPKWKRLLNQHAQEEQSKRPPHAAHADPRKDASEEEERPNQDVGVGSDVMGDYLDALEMRKQLIDTEVEPEDQAQKYLEAIIDEVPTAVGGVNIHSEIKKAFIAGTKAR